MSRFVVLALAFASVILGQVPTVGANAKVIVRGPSTHKSVALTIDDGYDPERCQEIYDTLVEFGIPATWLPNAVHVRKAPALWRKIAQRFEIANHTTHHLSLPSLSKRQMRDEIASDERIVESITGREMSKILRPPYGAYDRSVVREAGRLGYEVVALWDVTSADTAKDPPDRKVAQNMLRGHPGAIILLHCGPAVTPRVLPIVIARYACEGFRFASLTDLLAGRPGTAAKVDCPPPRLPPAEKRKPRPPISEELLANDWRLVEATTGDAMAPVAPDEAFTLGFAGRTASGTLDCETFSARLRMKRDGSLKFRKPVRDDAACEVPVRPEATSHLDLLLSTVGYKLDVVGSLVFVDAAGRDRLRFDALSAAAIVGAWTVTSIADEVGPMTPTAPATVTFTAESEVHGSTGCDSYSGSYRSAEEALAIGEVRLGGATCDVSQTTQQASFLAALDSVVTWGLADGTLDLRDPLGRSVLVLTPAEQEPVPSPSASP